MLHLKVNYEQKTIFINATCVGIRICRLILHIPNYLTVETKYILFVVVGNYRKLCLPESYWFESGRSIIFLLYVFFRVIPWRLNFICRRFGTLSVPFS